MKWRIFPAFILVDDKTAISSSRFSHRSAHAALSNVAPPCAGGSFMICYLPENGTKRLIGLHCIVLLSLILIRLRKHVSNVDT
ncbi:hypothetical protein KCP76_23395 [Salmonella enterica subsp. enterica serovar Weltevreden]|nr:hypothetical protein KCP76_23395 [Salmonella enterica subsp. enterica serovar Weltevreden]